MAGYLGSWKAFCLRSAFNEQMAEELESKRPGHIAALDEMCSRFVDARLRKRVSYAGPPYAIPFSDPPEIVKQWVADLLTPRAFDSLGRRPSDEIQASIVEREKLARSDLEEAADSQMNKFDLPLSPTDNDTAFTQPAPLMAAQQSPFTAKHLQYDRVKGNRRYG